MELFCDLATSEMHEKNYCLQSGGMSKYGSSAKWLSADVYNAAVDYVVGDWISESIAAQ